MLLSNVISHFPEWFLGLCRHDLTSHLTVFKMLLKHCRKLSRMATSMSPLWARNKDMRDAGKIWNQTTSPSSLCMIMLFTWDTKMRRFWHLRMSTNCEQRQQTSSPSSPCMRMLLPSLDTSGLSSRSLPLLSFAYVINTCDDDDEQLLVYGCLRWRTPPYSLAFLGGTSSECSTALRKNMWKEKWKHHVSIFCTLNFHPSFQRRHCLMSIMRGFLSRY